MSTSQTVDDRTADENVLANPLVRWALALGSSTIVALIAVLLLEGTVRWIVLGIAVLNVVVEPKILEMAARQEA